MTQRGMKLKTAVTFLTVCLFLLSINIFFTMGPNSICSTNPVVKKSEEAAKFGRKVNSPGTGFRNPLYYDLTRDEVVLEPGLFKDTFQDLEDLAKDMVVKERNGGAAGKSEKEGHKRGMFLGHVINSSVPSYTAFLSSLGGGELYSEREYDTVRSLMKHLATAKILHVREMLNGTQLKLLLNLEGGVDAIAKIKRAPLDRQMDENVIFNADLERHEAEIATFYLDRLLGFRRTIPVSGRTLNITSEIYSLLPKDDKLFRKTFYISPAGNLCFYGTCKQLCTPTFPSCGNPDLIEASIAVLLPSPKGNLTLFSKVRSPWRRAYKVYHTTQWQHNATYCQSVKRDPQFPVSQLLDFVDQHVLDFLTGNMDRHHMYLMETPDEPPSKPPGYPVHLDNGRGFYAPFRDEVSILAPLYQCCVVRLATLRALLTYLNGPIPLSKALRDSLDEDPLSPGLVWEPHLAAMDRRLPMILSKIRDCVGRSEERVLYS